MAFKTLSRFLRRFAKTNDSGRPRSRRRGISALWQNNSPSPTDSPTPRSNNHGLLRVITSCFRKKKQPYGDNIGEDEAVCAEPRMDAVSSAELAELPVYHHQPLPPADEAVSDIDYVKEVPELDVCEYGGCMEMEEQIIALVFIFIVLLLHHSIVEVIDGGDQEENTITTDKSEQLEDFQSSTERQQTVEKQQQHTSKQAVNNQQEIPRVTSFDQFEGMNTDVTDEAITEQQTADKAVHQNLQEISSDTVINITEATILAYEQNDYTDNTEASLLTNPQQCCRSARSLSRSPRIVSLQVELGFVSVAYTDLDLLQSNWSPEGLKDILVALGISP